MLINIFKENLFIPNQQNNLSNDQPNCSFLNSLHDLRKKILIMVSLKFSKIKARF